MKLVPIKPGQWVVLELPRGRVLQGRAVQVTDKTVQLDGSAARYSREHVVSAMGRMTRDDDGTVRQNPARTEYGRKRAELRRYMAAWTGEGPELDKLIRSYHAVDVDNELEFYRAKGMPPGTTPKKGRSMATKKPSAAQLAARKLFAQRARSGAFKRKGNPTRSTRPKARKAAPARPKARTRNPRMLAKVGSVQPTKYAVHRAVDGAAGPLIATFAKKTDAVQYGRALVNAKRIAVVIVGKR